MTFIGPQGASVVDNCFVLWSLLKITIFLYWVNPAAIVMHMYLYSLAFMEHPCTLGAAVCHQAPPCPLYTQHRARLVWARRTNGLKGVSNRAGFHYENTPIQIYWKFYNPKKGNFQLKNANIFSYFCPKHRLWVLVRTASAVLTSNHNLCFGQK